MRPPAPGAAAIARRSSPAWSVPRSSEALAVSTRGVEGAQHEGRNAFASANTGTVRPGWPTSAAALAVSARAGDDDAAVASLCLLQRRYLNSFMPRRCWTNFTTSAGCHRGIRRSMRTGGAVEQVKGTVPATEISGPPPLGNRDQRRDAACWPGEMCQSYNGVARTARKRLEQRGPVEVGYHCPPTGHPRSPHQVSCRRARRCTMEQGTPTGRLASADLVTGRW